MSHVAPSLLPTQRRSTRHLMILGLILTVQIFDLVLTLVTGPGRIYLAAAIALLAFGGVLALRSTMCYLLRRATIMQPGDRTVAQPAQSVSGLRNVNITLLSLAIMLQAVWFSHNFRPCGWLDLARRIDGCVGALHHIGTVTTLDVSTDGQFLAARSLTGNVSLWQISQRQLLRRRAEDIAVGHTLAFSPDGRMLATGLSDGTVQLSDVPSGAVVRTFGIAAKPINGVTFSDDGALLAAGAWDQTVRVWRVRDGTLLHSFSGLDDSIHSVTFSPDGTLLAAGDQHMIWVWKVATGQLHLALETGSLTENIAFSPDGVQLAAGGWRGGVAVWRVQDGKFLKTLGSLIGQISSIAFSPDGTLLAVARQSQVASSEIEVWRVGDSTQIRTINPRARVAAITWMPDGTQLAVAAAREVALWRIR